MVHVMVLPSKPGSTRQLVLISGATDDRSCRGRLRGGNACCGAPADMHTVGAPVQDFLDISNPKAVLETTLRGFSCLTRGDCICLHYNNKRYYIDIVETRPQVGVNIYCDRSRFKR